jgi:hypothetical protein
VIEWIQKNLPLLGAAATLGVFILYGARQRTLEIRKLKLELEKLRDESRIYRPTQDEIERVLRHAGKLPTLSKRFIGGSDSLEPFREKLEGFVLLLSAYYGDNESRILIGQRRLAAAMSHHPDPYPNGFDRHPNPTGVAVVWRSVREAAQDELPSDTFETIDAFCRRFSSSQVRA